LAKKWGEERVLSGDYPGNARKRESVLRALPLEPETTTVSSVDTTGSEKTADPTSIRPALAQIAAENLDGLQRALLDAALSATTTKWATVSCSDCGARSRVELPVPDVRSRLQAIETLLAQGLGRPGQAEEQPTPRLPSTVAAVKEMGWDEMHALFASLYVDEISAVQRDGGESLVRAKLAALSEGERRVLRKALLEPEFA
jgi:hypothetical protein